MARELTEPSVEIKRTGRWSWWLTYHAPDGNPYGNTAVVFGPRRTAERVARRKLRHEQKQTRYAAQQHIRVAPPMKA